MREGEPVPNTHRGVQSFRSRPPLDPDLVPAQHRGVERGPEAYIVIDGPGHDATRLALREGITSFGRLPANDVILLGDLVSRHHARITFFEGQATLQDLNSHNGSWVNGERTKCRVLEPGDSVRVGNFRISFHRGPMPSPPDETTAGEEGGARADLPAEDDPEGAAALLRELEGARRGAPSPTRAVHFLYRATLALARSADERAYGDELLELALEHIPADDAGWLRRCGQGVEWVARRGPQGALPLPKAPHPAAAWALEHSFAVRAPSGDPRFSPCGAVVVSPVEGPGAGVLVLERPSAFGAEDLHRLVALARLMGEGLGDLRRRRYGPQAIPSAARPAVVALFDLHGLASMAPEAPEATFALLGALHRSVRARAEAAGGRALPLNGHRALLVLEQGGAKEALEAALALRAEVDAALADFPSLGPRRLRGALASGPVLFGVPEGGTAAAFGPPTAAALRMVDAAGPGRLLVDEATATSAGGGFELRRVGSAPRPGLQPSAIYELAASGP